MRHQIFGRQLNRNTNERKQLFVNLAKSLILHGRIKTTLAKAKAIQPWIEKMVTRAKVNTLYNRRVLLKNLFDKKAVDKLLKVIGPTFKDVEGGYTKIIKLKERTGDKALEVLISFSRELINTEEKELKKNKTKIAEKPLLKSKERKADAKNKANKKK